MKTFKKTVLIVTLGAFFFQACGLDLKQNSEKKRTRTSDAFRSKCF